MRQLRQSSSLRFLYWIKRILDDFNLDPLVGFIPVIGDLLPSLLIFPFLYVSIFEVKSLPLTLAIIYNVLKDVFLGLLPYHIGNVIDIFNKGYRENYLLITGFIEGDCQVIWSVRRKATVTALLIILLLLLIAGLIWAIKQFAFWIFG